MFFNPIDIPDLLIEAQEQGKLVVFAGAGVAMGEPSCLPSFKGLAAHIAEGHPLAAQIDKYEARLDRFLGELSRRKVDVQELCRRRIGDPNSRPTELHRGLVDLFIKPEDIRIVTTNFDSHFQTVLGEHNLRSDCYYAPALPLGDQFSGLIYLHGGISRPEPLVLTDEDFGRAYLTEGWAREFLQRLFAEFTTVFVGYSHNDLPVEYLARGMSGKSIAPRFALAAIGDEGQWGSLGIEEIVFEKTQGSNPFENLCSGVRKWADFTKQQPTDIAERVKNIVCSPESLTPDKAQSSLLKRCLERENSCHFFTNEAKGWLWVKWLHNEGLLTPLFDPSRRELNIAQLHLTFWLAARLLAEKSDDGLLLVEQYAGTVGRHLWTALCRGLWHDDKVDWNSPLIQKWVLLLVETCPRDSQSQLSHLFPQIATASPHTLGILLFRHFTTPRIELTKSLDFASPMSGDDTIGANDRAEFEIVLLGEHHDLATAWAKALKPRLTELGEGLVVLLENRLREVHALYRVSELSNATFDPCCSRGRIYERDSYPTKEGMSLVLDFLLDVIEERSKPGEGLPLARIEGWLTSGVPVLVRLGLYALHLSPTIPCPQKVKLIQRHNFVHPEVEGATHEGWQVLTTSYPTLDGFERISVWQAIDAGPQGKRPDDKPEAWEKFRQDEINKLTWFLATQNRGCSEAEDALRKLEERQPGFRGYEGMDQVIFGYPRTIEGYQSPRSATVLLSQSPASQIDFLLTYQGSSDPFEESRQGLLAAAAEACAKNAAWGTALLEELDSRQAWESDLWNAAFGRMSLSTLPAEKLNWLLKVLETHFADSPSLEGLTFFLFHSVDLSAEKRPAVDNLDLMIRISLLIWKQIKGAEPAVTEGFKEIEWANRAINHSAGRISEFWLKCCGLDPRQSGGQIPGVPEWLKGPLADMVKGMDYASQLGRAILGLHLPFVYQVDPAWVGAKLFPKLHFSMVGEEAFLLLN